ncbi:hypothetical protein CBR_g38468 [Chara braunii]|uniref:H/ACA ribonucleoprotein complex subunit 2 n=1 Tax=Chara braunii TaxID=69332 RepID=A0A388JNV9_CHABU|nr:hypothetical protein CBR_g38468 [Chara braunii]|eukprot:GBG59443.1 hypothetical protein CBR_g38468 [Chara braunii]
MGSDSETERKEKLKWQSISPIAKPLAGKKLTKKALKLVKRASKSKQLKRGVKEVVKALRKGAKGVCIVAGNISPIDVISHLPVLCEESDIPYVFVPSKEDLGAAGQSKRPTCCVLVMPSGGKAEVSEEDAAKLQSEYKELVEEVKGLAVIY